MWSQVGLKFQDPHYFVAKDTAYINTKVSNNKLAIIKIKLVIDINSANSTVFFVGIGKKRLFLWYFEKATTLKMILNIDGILPRNDKNIAYMEYPY